MGGELTIQAVGSFSVSLCGFLSRCKSASKVNAFAIYFYPRAPFSGRFDHRHAFVPRAVSLAQSSVLGVLALAAFPQVIRPIVSRVAVDMINYCGGPFPRDKKPSKAMSIVKAVIYGYANIPVGMNAASFVSSPLSPAPFCFPSKNSCLGAIRQKFKNAQRNSFIFHAFLMSSVKTFVNRRVP